MKHNTAETSEPSSYNRTWEHTKTLETPTETLPEFRLDMSPRVTKAYFLGDTSFSLRSSKNIANKLDNFQTLGLLIKHLSIFKTATKLIESSMYK